MVEDLDTIRRPKLVTTLYEEALDLAEDARGYFENLGQWDRKQLDPMSRVVFSCESLKVTTRVMHAIAWLLVQKAVAAGEMSEEDARATDRRLGGMGASTSPADPARLAKLPAQAQFLIERSQSLYDRVAHLERHLNAREDDPPFRESPVRALLSQLEARF